MFRCISLENHRKLPVLFFVVIAVFYLIFHAVEQLLLGYVFFLVSPLDDSITRDFPLFYTTITTSFTFIFDLLLVIALFLVVRALWHWSNRPTELSFPILLGQLYLTFLVTILPILSFLSLSVPPTEGGFFFITNAVLTSFVAPLFPTFIILAILSYYEAFDSPRTYDATHPTSTPPLLMLVLAGAVFFSNLMMDFANFFLSLLFSANFGFTLDNVVILNGEDKLDLVLSFLGLVRLEGILVVVVVVSFGVLAVSEYLHFVGRLKLLDVIVWSFLMCVIAQILLLPFELLVDLGFKVVGVSPLLAVAVFVNVIARSLFPTVVAIAIIGFKFGYYNPNHTKQHFTAPSDGLSNIHQLD